MKKIITLSLISLATAFSPSIFAYCSFPHHYKILGPANTHIIKIERIDYNLSNIKIDNVSLTSNSFDVVQINTQKYFGGPLLLEVGTDDEHYTQIEMFDLCQGYAGTQLETVRGFMLDTVDGLGSSNITMVFKQQ